MKYSLIYLVILFGLLTLVNNVSALTYLSPSTSTSPLEIGNGGTGTNTITQFGIVIGNNTSALQSVGPDATVNQPLLSAGASANPAFGALPLGNTNAVSGTLPVTRGGTGCTGGVAFASLPASPTAGTMCLVTNTTVCQVGTPITSAQAGGSIGCEVTYIGGTWQPASGAASLTPMAGTAGNLLFDTGSVWASLTPTGDVSTGTGPSIGSLGLVGQEGLTYIGSALSASVAGQFRATDGAGDMVVDQIVPGACFSLTGSPSASMVIPFQLPTTITFNANFAAVFGQPSSNSCTGAPAETDTWTVRCIQSGALTIIGTVAVSTSCGGTGDTGAVYATTGHNAQTCSPGRMTITAPATVSGTNESFFLPSHL